MDAILSIFSKQNISLDVFITLWNKCVPEQNKTTTLQFYFSVFCIVKLGAWSLFGVGEKWRKEVNPSVDQNENTL